MKAWAVRNSKGDVIVAYVDLYDAKHHAARETERLKDQHEYVPAEIALLPVEATFMSPMHPAEIEDVLAGAKGSGDPIPG